MKEQKYYFITYQGEYSFGTVSIVNSVIDVSPLEFISNLRSKTKYGEHKIYGLVITFAMEIAKEEYEKYKEVSFRYENKTKNRILLRTLQQKRTSCRTHETS